MKGEHERERGKTRSLVDKKVGETAPLTDPRLIFFIKSRNNIYLKLNNLTTYIHTLILPRPVLSCPHQNSPSYLEITSTLPTNTTMYPPIQQVPTNTIKYLPPSKSKLPYYIRLYPHPPGTSIPHHSIAHSARMHKPTYLPTYLPTYPTYLPTYLCTVHILSGR